MIRDASSVLDSDLVWLHQHWIQTWLWWRYQCLKVCQWFFTVQTRYKVIASLLGRHGDIINTRHVVTLSILEKVVWWRHYLDTRSNIIIVKHRQCDDITSVRDGDVVMSSVLKRHVVMLKHSNIVTCGWWVLLSVAGYMLWGPHRR